MIIRMLDTFFFIVYGFKMNQLLTIICWNRAGKVFLNSVEYLDPESMEWTTFVNRYTDDSRSEASSSRRESITNLPTVDEDGELKAEIDPNGSESDEHSI